MLTSRNMIVMGAFLLPVLCCLIGIGAFVLATTPVSDPTPIDPNQPQTPQVSIEELRAQLARLNEGIASLHARLGKEEERAALAQKVKELIDKLESDTTGAAEGLSGLAKEIAAIEMVLQEINSSQSGAEGLGDAQPPKGPERNSGPTLPAIPLLTTAIRSGRQI
jgi:hypothetical protein